jgi:hypothetical protein
VSTHIDVPLDSLFLSEVVSRNTNDDGTLKDPNLQRRMENPICQQCHETFRKKYPGKAFNIACSGIYDERDYNELKAQYEAENPGEKIPIESMDEPCIREIYDVVYWAQKYILVKDEEGEGELIPFFARGYQSEVLRCTASHKVDRMGRGLGKTITGVIEELHKACTRKKYAILVVCPAQSQSQMWFDQILLQIENSPMLRDALATRKQQPFFFFRFYNGSTISIFTAGSKSGRGADAVRGQDPDRVRIDEQDYLADKDYQAIMPLVRRKKNSEFHGASTPTGLRGMYWQMCTRLSQYREFYFPINFHPQWGPAKEAQCIAEAKTMDRYRHEFLAEFGDPSQGVFKGLFIDRARSTPYEYVFCQWDPTKKYFMGVDWNGRGTGTRVRVIEFDPATSIRKCVHAEAIDAEGATTTESLRRIRDLNRKWRCEDIFIDAGFGFAQDELLRLMGRDSDNALDKKLLQIKVIDFGATTEFNALVSKREIEHSLGGRRKAADSVQHLDEEDRLERRTKPFMVDGSVMAFEAELVQISPNDHLLEEQLRGYRVKTYSAHGYPSTYEPATEVGDHDLDAFMLAMLACEMKYGILQAQEHVKRLVRILHVGAFGVSQVTDATTPVSDPGTVRRAQMGLKSRTQATDDNREKYRIQYMMRNGAYIAPNFRGGAGGVGGGRSTGRGTSRTEIFRKPPYRRF